MTKRTNANIIAANGEALRPSPVDVLPIPLEGSITVELDTGRVVEMVVGELSMLYELGEIPDELTEIAARELFPPDKSSDRNPPQRYAERMRLVRWVVERVLVTKIPVNHLYHDELWEIWGLANSPARAMDNFRRQQARHVGSVSAE